MFCDLIYATICSIIQKHVPTIESNIVCCQYDNLKHVATIKSHIVCYQYADLPCGVKYKTNSRMNPSVKENIIMEIFKKISKEIFLCKRCFDNEIYCGVTNEQEMLIHVYHRHRGFWNASIFQPNSVSEHVWLKLFDRLSHPVIKCKHCNMIFYNARIRLLHTHIKTRHGILLLAFSL